MNSLSYQLSSIPKRVLGLGHILGLMMMMLLEASDIGQLQQNSRVNPDCDRVAFLNKEQTVGSGAPKVLIRERFHSPRLRQR